MAPISAQIASPSGRITMTTKGWAVFSTIIR
jgi:hypothetical protein